VTSPRNVVKDDYLSRLLAAGEGMHAASAASAGAAVVSAPAMMKPKFPEGYEETTIVYTDGTRYEGGVLDSKWHNRGKCFYANGDIYEGEVDNDALNGVGTLIYANGDKYIGQFKDDQRHGRGCYTSWNNDMYEGDFEHDQRSGNGRYVMACGDKYEGQFLNGLPNGKGGLFFLLPFFPSSLPSWLLLTVGSLWPVFTFENGATYKGDFVDDQFHGKGEFVSPQGLCYKGDFVMGQKHGKGSYHWPNGDVYEGDIHEGKPHGQGGPFLCRMNE